MPRPIAVESPSRYVPAPSLRAAERGRVLQSGQRGPAVRELQNSLNAAMASCRLRVDGFFGGDTQQAIMAFQRQAGIAVDGKVGPQTLEALRHAQAERGVERTVQSAPAPARAPNRPPVSTPIPEPAGASRPQPAPSNSKPARAASAEPAATPAPKARSTTAAKRPGPKAQASAALPSAADQQPRRPQAERPPARPSAAAVPTQVVASASSSGNDRSLIAAQARTLASAEAELANWSGLSRDARRERVNSYADSVRMPQGKAWCGYFVGYNFTEAGWSRDIHQMSNALRAMHFFLYRQFTDTSRQRHIQLDAQRTEHQSAGSTRQFWTLEGSLGQQYLSPRRRNMPADFDMQNHIRTPEELPLRPGDVMMLRTGGQRADQNGRPKYFYHIAIVQSYDPSTGTLRTIEGNTEGGHVRQRQHDVRSDDFRARLYGFGRPALGDFQTPGADAS